MKQDETWMIVIVVATMEGSASSSLHFVQHILSDISPYTKKNFVLLEGLWRAVQCRVQLALSCIILPPPSASTVSSFPSSLYT